MSTRLHAHRSFGIAALAAALSSCAAGGPSSESFGRTTQAVDTLTQVGSFGMNPGNLLMYAYAPQNMPANAPLVVALHGCTQTASDYVDAGWNTLADQYGFYVLYPQDGQGSCFDWFGESAADATRGQGEAASVIQMVDWMKAHYSIDPKRVFVNGMSAGAGYAVVLLSLYPDVFAAGSSFEGLAFGCTETCQSSPPQNTAQQWGTLVKNAYPGYAGPYPRISIWEGTADTIVPPANQPALVAQWTNLTGASSTPTKTDTVNGAAHAEYADGSGAVTVETYTITGMSHAVAIDPSHGCGTAAAFFSAQGLCSVTYSAQFFGITTAPGSGSSSGSSSGSGSGPGSGSGSGSGSSSGAPSGAGPLDGGDVVGDLDAPGASGCVVGRSRTGAGAGAAAAVFLGLASARRRRSRHDTRVHCAGVSAAASSSACAAGGAAHDHERD